jgi:hypothetical protein
VVCGQVLYAKLTVDNACDMLILADLHSAKLLKQLTVSCEMYSSTVLMFLFLQIAYCKQHSHDVVTTIGWKQVLTRPDLITELFK